MAEPAIEHKRSSEPDLPAHRDVLPGHSRTWFLAVGGLLVLAGFVALVFPLVSTLATKVLLSWLLMFAGLAQLGHAFNAGTWSGSMYFGLTGLAWLAGGLFTLVYPLVGTLSFTVALAVMFIAQGFFGLFAPARDRVESSVAWRIFSSVIAIIAGLLVLFGLPSSALWALGVIAGANFITTGVSYMVIGSAERRAPAGTIHSTAQRASSVRPRSERP